MTALRSYQDERGFGLSLPDRWYRLAVPPGAAVFAAVDPDQRAGFCANAVVTVDDLSATPDPALWQAALELRMERHLVGYRLLDREHTDGAATRRLLHHVVGQSVPVTVEQRSEIAAMSGIVLTVSVPTAAYNELADLVARICDSWETAR